MNERSTQERLDYLEQQLDELRSKDEITQAIYRASRAVDRCDVEMMASAFHEDATDYRGVAQGAASNTRNSLQNWPVAVSRHVTTNVSIQLDGDVARVESYVDAFHYFPELRDGKGQFEFIQARYLDRFERRDGVWKIARRITVWDPSWIEPSYPSYFVEADGDYVTDRNFITSRRDKADIYYSYRLPVELEHHEPDARY